MAITQNGEAKAVLKDLQRYEQTQETLELLKIRALDKQEIEAGNLSPAQDAIARVRLQLDEDRRR